MRDKYVPVATRPGVLVGLVGLAGLAGMAGLSGCGSSSKVTSPTSVPVTTSGPASSSSSAGASSGATQKGVVGTESTKYGTVLESNGKTLYLLTADTPTSSKCTDSGCIAVWPPLTGTATAGSGVKASMLGHLSLPDGTQQVTYGGHPLYFYVGDGGAGQTNGQGIASFGGTWYVVSASTGQAVTKAVSVSGGSGSATTSSGYGGY